MPTGKAGGKEILRRGEETQSAGGSGFGRYVDGGLLRHRNNMYDIVTGTKVTGNIEQLKLPQEGFC